MATWWGNNYDNDHHGPEQNQYGLGGDDTLVTTHKDLSYFLYGGNGDDELVGYNAGDQLSFSPRGDMFHRFDEQGRPMAH